MLEFILNGNWACDSVFKMLFIQSQSDLKGKKKIAMNITHVDIIQENRKKRRKKQTKINF